MGGHPQGLAKGSYAWFCLIRVVNVIVLQLVFLTNPSPTVANGDQNGIHHQQRAPQMYDLVHKNFSLSVLV